MNTRQKLAFSVISILLIAGCGQRGPLFLPEPATKNQSSDSPTSAPNEEKGVE